MQELTLRGSGNAAPFLAVAVEPVRTRAVYSDGRMETALSDTLCEHTLDIVVNLRHVARLVCTRSELESLVTGFLYTERIIDSVGEIERLWLCRSGNTARVFLTKELQVRPAQRTDKSCCTKNVLLLDAAQARPLREIEDRSRWSSADVFRLCARMRKEMPIHAKTDGTHCCFLMRRGEIVFGCEDVGRHNALDKAIGYALRCALPLSECLLYTSGRVPLDMTEKAIAAGIPVLVSKATPTAQSVRLAARYGLTLICRAWEDRYEICEGTLPDWDSDR